MTLGAIHVSQVPQSGWPRPLIPPIGCNLSTNRKRKPKWRRCVAASIVVGPSATLTGSRTRPSDWGSNARFGPRKTEETIVGLPRLLVLSVFSRFGGCHFSAPAELRKVCLVLCLFPSERAARVGYIRPCDCLCAPPARMMRRSGVAGQVWASAGLGVRLGFWFPARSVP